MKNPVEALLPFYQRDLDRLYKEIEQLDEAQLWESEAGITNSCGVLAKHMTGNLLHYIGKGLGDTGYERNRDEEFKKGGLSKKELLDQIKHTSDVINDTLKNIEAEQLFNDFPLETKFDFTTIEFLNHLYGHFNYHLGQVNYLRRILGEN